MIAHCLLIGLFYSLVVPVGPVHVIPENSYSERMWNTVHYDSTSITPVQICISIHNSNFFNNNKSNNKVKRLVEIGCIVNLPNLYWCLTTCIVKPDFEWPLKYSMKICHKRGVK